MRLERSRFVEGDLEAIADYIAADNPRRAVSFIQEIRLQFHKIAKDPLLYRLRPEIGEEARLVAFGNRASWLRIDRCSQSTFAATNAKQAETWRSRVQSPPRTVNRTTVPAP